MEKSIKKEKKVSEHYVNNRMFSSAVSDFVLLSKKHKREGLEPPQIPEYIGECFMKICEGLSHKPNFSGYSYRDEMVMDAVENCVKAVAKFDIDRTTRTGLPNAFAYFTQISYFAFLRRIAKEKRQWDIKLRYIESAGTGSFAEFGDDSDLHGDSMIAKIRGRSAMLDDKDSFFIDDDKPLKKKRATGWGNKKAAKEASAIELTDYLD
jgi:hypothetical protein